MNIFLKIDLVLKIMLCIQDMKIVQKYYLFKSQWLASENSNKYVKMKIFL